jgi:hypothetical protein
MPPSRLPGDRWLRPEWNRCLDALSALWNRLGPEGTVVVLTALLAASGEEENEPEEVARLHAAARP